MLDVRVSQYPWEVVVNGMLPSDVEHPPRYQLLLLHPELSLELSTESLDKFTPKEVMSVDVVGVTRYTSDHYRHFWGLSAITAHRSDLGIGFGGRIRFGSIVSAGVTWDDADRDGEYFDQAPYVIISADLFRVLQSRAEKLVEIRKRLR